MDNHIRWTNEKEIKAIANLESKLELTPWSADLIAKYLETKNVVSMIVSDAKEGILGYILYSLDADRFLVYRLVATKGEIAFMLLHKVMTRLNSARRGKIYIIFDDDQLLCAVADAIRNFTTYDPVYALDDGDKIFKIAFYRDKYIAYYPSSANPDDFVIEELIKEPWEREG